MDTNFDNAMNQLHAANPAKSNAGGRAGSRDFAGLNRSRLNRRITVGLALFAFVAIPSIATIATRGGNDSTVQFADGSIDGLKGAAKKSSQTVSYAGAPSLDLGALPTELIGADQNFRTSRDGFSFPNYGGKPANDEIDATTMAALFGKAAVCADQSAALCVMVPGAQAVADQLNEAMASGRCEGMSVLAQRFYDGLDVRPNGAASTAQITQDQVAKQIGYWWATQVAPPVAANSKLYRAMTPSQVTTELVKGLKNRAGLTLGLYSSVGGHSVNPIAVTKDGANFNIYVYDNNYPNEIRKVVVNPTTESWTYGAAALNSSSASSTWTGSGAGSFDLTTMASRQGPFKVSLGSTKGVKGTNYSVIVTQQGNTTEPVGFKLTSRFGVVNSLDVKSVSNAEFPIKSFLGAGVGQGAIAFIPTVFAEESGLELEIVGGDDNGKYTVSIMRTGAAGVVVESNSKFEVSLTNSALKTDFVITLLNPSDGALVQLSSGNSGTDIQLANGQSIKVSTTVVDDDAFRGSRRIEYPESLFEIYSWNGKLLTAGKVEADLAKGQVQRTKLSINSNTGEVARRVVNVKGFKVDDKFINSIVPSTPKSNFDKPTTKPNAKFIEALQPIQLPTRAIAGVTTTTTSVPASTTSAPFVTNPPAPTPPSTPTTTLPAQEIVVTVRAQRYYGDENSSIQPEAWSVASCEDSSGDRLGCSLFEESANAAASLGDLMQLSVEIDQMADAQSYSSLDSDDLSAAMKSITGWPANYSIDIVVELEIEKRPLLVTVNSDQSKVYGDDDPSFTFETSGLMNDADLAGTLSREVGEFVDTYSIVQGTLDAGSNYVISFTEDTFAVTPKTLTVTADAVSKTYGSDDPEFTYLAPELETGDSLTGSLDREAGDDVGTYAIGLGSLANSNYDITFNSDDLTIDAKALTVTADAVSKTYGSDDPEFTYLAPELETGDSLTGSLDREAGEDVGTYAIGLGSLANSNYDITFNSDDLTIDAKALTVTADAVSKTYGSDDPEFTYLAPELETGDSLTGSLDREIGEDVGTYAIGLGSLANSNYDITFNSDDLTIDAKALTVTADAVSKTYGSDDPEFTFATIGLETGDSLTGSLDREAGEDVGTYAINIGSLANSNYDITFNSDDLTIDAKALTVTADAVSKTYGSDDPEFTYLAPELETGDSLTGSLDREIGEDVGTYAIGLGSLANSNYDITFNSDDLTIDAKALTVTAEAVSKTYGSDDPEFTYLAPELETGDSLTGSLDREAGDDVGTYAIGLGSLANSNYDITFNSDDLTIDAKALTVTADAVSKTYGFDDPELTYSAPELETGDSLTGALDRVEGENIGTYAIGQGSLTIDANYSITYVAANLTVNAKAASVTADAVSKTYGDVDPALTYSVIGLKSGDSLTGALTRSAGENVGTHAINQGTLGNTNYDITFTSANLTISTKSLTVTANAVSKTYGDVDPALTYSAPGLKSGDSLTGALTRSAGESVGTYAIGQGTLGNSNYSISFTSANLTISTKSLTVTANAVSKTYDDVDPALTYSAPGLKSGDSLTGALTRSAGESVGTYAIGQGTLGNSNYSISFTSANLTINTKALTVTANSVSKTYGSGDPELTFATIGLKSGDSLTGALTRVAGEDVGTYAIQQGSLLANSNYSLSFSGNILTISAKPINVVVNAGSPTLVGSTTQATATSESSGAVSWTASPSNICSISASGVVTGLRAGNCTITANVAASGNYQAGVGSTTIVIEAVRSNCGGGNGGDANTPGCTGGGKGETGTLTLSTDAPVTTEDPTSTTTTVPESTTTTVAPTTTTTVAPTTTTTVAPTTTTTVAPTTTTTVAPTTTTTVAPTTTDPKGKSTK